MENMVSNKNYFVDNVWNYLPELKDKAVTDGFEKKQINTIEYTLKLSKNLNNFPILSRNY